MPRNPEINKVLVLGAGPIVIGQACEFDYSGTQACKSLREEGIKVVLVNSNPATIMTDPGTADVTYIEPLTVSALTKVIEKERPDSLLPTMGGQTALNLAVELAESGVLDKYGVKLIGANISAIKLAEDRAMFRDKMIEIGVPVPKSWIIHNVKELESLRNEIKFPQVVRPAFTLGGTGGGIAYNIDDLLRISAAGLAASPVSEVLIETYLNGWKELELEVVRDKADNFIVICHIENIDPMGVHTGDSITVAPLQTVTDREYQELRDASKRIMNAIGVDCGGSNVQFAIDPVTGEYVVIEMNPRVSRSSALASKATGYPIAKVSAKLAVGFTLDEVKNEIAGGISACFEPSIDYVVTKIPRFDFGKFAGANETLGTEMKSVGEVMAIGATFQESMQKALRGLELGLNGYSPQSSRITRDLELWKQRLASPSRHRLNDTWGAFKAGFTVEELNQISGIDHWFLDNLYELWQVQEAITHQWAIRAENAAVCEQEAERISIEDIEEKNCDLETVIYKDELLQLKKMGFGDKQIANIVSKLPGFAWVREDDIFGYRRALNMVPGYSRIDTCAAEFPGTGNYLYSSYHTSAEGDREYAPDKKRRVMVLGSGPNRIGQGIEFDYCCVQSVLELRDMNITSIMVNCNPETVSTDYDTSDVLYFESLTLEDVSEVAMLEKPDGIIIQFGGQTPLKLAHGLEARGFKILGTSPDSTDLAEDRARFGRLVTQLGLKQAEGDTAFNSFEAERIAEKLGFPLLVRPSYVLGGRAMHVVQSMEQLKRLMKSAFSIEPEKPVLLDRFLEGATEVDVDVVCDGNDTVIAGVMEHVEEAGVHSGDSSCILPPQNLSAQIVGELKEASIKLATALKVVGALNVQWAVYKNEIYVLEANPRASRTLPFVCKATGVPWVKIATRAIMGESLKSMSHLWTDKPQFTFVKSVVIPFSRFHGSKVFLGPEMRSTGEVMGVGKNFEIAYAKAQAGAGLRIPDGGKVLVSSSDHCLPRALEVLAQYQALGFEAILTRWTPESDLKDFSSAELFCAKDMDEASLAKTLQNKGVSLAVSVGELGDISELDQKVRRACIKQRIPLLLTAESALALAKSISAIRTEEETVHSIQSLHEMAAETQKLEFAPMNFEPAVDTSMVQTI